MCLETVGHIVLQGCQTGITGQKFLGGEHGFFLLTVPGMLIAAAVLPGRISILCPESLVEIPYIRKSALQTDIQKGVIGQQKQLPGFFAAQLCDIFLKSDSETFFKKWDR